MLSERTGKSTREHFLGVGLAVGFLAQDLARAQLQVEGLCENGMRIAISLASCLCREYIQANEGVRTTDDGSLTSTLDGGVGGKDGLALESSDGHHLGGSDRSSGGAGRGDEVSGEHIASVVTLSDRLWFLV
jgi:hypothetical protein